MNIYLIQIDEEHLVFYSEGSEDAGATVRRPGLRGWVEQKYLRLQNVLHESEGAIGSGVRRAWAWLQRRTHADESMLRSLRKATALRLHFPSRMQVNLVKIEWKAYLASRRRRHFFWFILNALVSPLTVLLAPLPGPNVIGYWFLYRAICHLLALSGISQADKLPIEYLPSEILDERVGKTDSEAIARIAQMLSLVGLQEFVQRTVVSERKLANSPVAV